MASGIGPYSQISMARFKKKITIIIIITAIWRAKDALANRMQRELSFYIM